MRPVNSAGELGSNPELGLAQVQQLFAYFLADAGIVLADDRFYREPPQTIGSWYIVTRSSRALRDILAGMLRYSNNFIANQLFLTLGAQASGYPATTETSQEALQVQLAALYGPGFGDSPDLLLMTEGRVSVDISAPQLQASCVCWSSSFLMLICCPSPAARLERAAH